MAINAIGNGIPFPKGKSIPSSIKKAMVLWYDLKRQGATNESMAANPKLIDLSGNGHDATCYNFAWSGMSGIGGFPFSFGGNKINFPTWNYTTILERTDNSIKLKLDENANGNWVIQILHDAYTNIKYSLYVETDIVEGSAILIANTNYEQQERRNLHNGLNIIRPFNTEKFDLPCDVYIQIPKGATINLVLNSIYPNALVADGVDDYVMVEGLPLLNTTDGYTVIAKRKIISATNTNYQSFATKERSNSTGAFIFERIVANSPNIVQIYSFGQLNVLPTNYFDNEIIYQTPNQFNDSTIKSGDGNDNDVLWIASSATTHHRNVAIYSFILFNRTLTEEEINWVKTNLIEGDTEL